MPFNGSGTFNRDNGVNSGASVWQNDRDGGANILADRHDVHDKDIGDALTNCITKDGQTNPSADLPMNSQKHTGVANADGRTQYGVVGQLQDNAYLWGGTSGGSGVAYTITLAPAVTSLVTGMTVMFKSDKANTGNATLQVNATSATAIKTTTGFDVHENYFDTDTIVTCTWDGTNWITTNTPCGFASWTPTYAGSGSMTYTSVTTTTAVYQANGSNCTFFLDAVGTTGGTPSTSLLATPPIAAVQQDLFAARTDDGGATVTAGGTISSGLTYIEVFKNDVSNYSSGSGRAMKISGSYRIT